MSWSLAVLGALACSLLCVDECLGYAAYSGLAAVSPYAPYTPAALGGFDMGFMGVGHNFPDDRSTGEPEMLNCYASFLTQDGRGVANEMAVTVEQKIGDSDFFPSIGFGMGLDYGMGLDHHGGASRGPGLSARVELINNVEGGKGYIVFTKTAHADDGCYRDSFGDVLLPRDAMRDSDEHHHHGFGGYDMTGFGMMGYGMDLGMVGYGMGFGMGHGKQSMFDDNEGEGVVSEINIAPGALTSAVIENIGFTDLKQLAGRGVLICSNIQYDWNWKPTCEEPFFSCCNLKYDNKPLTLTALRP